MGSNHLKMRRGRWSFRLRVPTDLKNQLETEVTRDLGTTDRRRADWLAQKLATDLRGLFSVLRARAALGDPLSDARALVRQLGDQRLGCGPSRVVPRVEPESAQVHLAAPPPARVPELVPTPSPPPPRERPGKRLGQALDLYLEEKLATGRWESDRAIPYVHCRQFVDFAGADKQMDDVEPAMILSWVGGLRKRSGEPLGIGTRNNRVTAVSGFYRRAMARRWATWNPADQLRQTDERASHEKRNVFTMDELHAFFGPKLVEASRRPWRGKVYPSRLWAPLLMLGAGMREREAAQLAIEDVLEVDGILCARVTADVDDQGRRGRRRAKNRRVGGWFRFTASWRGRASSRTSSSGAVRSRTHEQRSSPTARASWASTGCRGGPPV